MSDKNRTIVHEAISEMLDHPDEYGIYPTTKCYDKLEAVLDKLDDRLAAAEEAARWWRMAARGYILEEGETHPDELWPWLVDDDKGGE